MTAHVTVLGVPVSLVDLRAAVQIILSSVARKSQSYICVRDVHGLMKAVEDQEMMRIQHGASMVTPDGMPLVWISRWRSKTRVGRVCGADLVDALCDAGQELKVRHFFYGGKPRVAEQMARNLTDKYP